MYEQHVIYIIYIDTGGDERDRERERAKAEYK